MKFNQTFIFSTIKHDKPFDLCLSLFINASSVFLSSFQVIFVLESRTSKKKTCSFII